MRLTRKQKSLINSNREKPAASIAADLKVSHEAVLAYLENRNVPSPPDKESYLLRLSVGSSLKDHIRNFWSQNKGRIVLIIFLIPAIYLSSLPNSFVSDDKPLMTSPNLGNPLPILQTDLVTALINSYTYTFNYLINGTNPLGYHLTNILLHLGVSLSLFFLLNLITNRRISFTASLIFAVNPLHTEAVSWISGRHYILYSLFSLLTLIFYLQYTHHTHNSKTGFYFSSLAFFIAAVYSFPEEAIVIPLLLPLIDFCRGKLSRLAKLYIPFFSLAIFFSLLSLARVTDRIRSVATDSPVAQNSGVNFVITGATAIFTYLKLFLYPIGLTFYHENFSLKPVSLILIFASVILIAVVLPILTLRKNRLIIFSVGLFLVSLIPTLTPFRVSWIVAERYAYFGSAGLSLIVAVVFDHLLRNRIWSKPATYSLFVLIVFYSLLTFRRGFDWKNEDTLWLATVRTSPNSSKAWNNLGDYYGRQGNAQKSFEAFVQAIKLNPNYADAWHNAGNVLLQAGQIDQAIPYFEKSLEFNPKLTETYNKLALAYNQKGDRDKALQMIQNSLAIDPNSARTYAALAQIEIDNGEIEKAKATLRQALNLDPENELLKNGLNALEANPLPAVPD